MDDVEGKVFIGGLSWQTTEGTLRAHFEKFGELTDVALMIDKRTGQPRGFGFIKLKYPAAADIVVAQEHVIDGRKVDVKKAVPRDRAPAPTRTESKKIFVGGLSAEVTDKIFHDYFSKFGLVKDAVVMVDRSTNRSRGFGFVTFEAEEAVDNVIKTENTILGKWVEVKRAEPRDMKFDPIGGGRGIGPGSVGFRGGRVGPGDMRMMGGRYGMTMNGRGPPMDDFQSGYGSMSPYGRGFSGAYPASYPSPSPYAMQPGYSASGYGSYSQGYTAGYGPSAVQQMAAGYSNPQGYGSRGLANDGDSSPIGSSQASVNYAMSQGVGSPSNLNVGGVNASSYDTYGRGHQQQYPYPSSAVAGYGSAYGLYGSPSANPRTMSAQDGYEGAYGAYRQGGTSQNRLDRGYKPY